MASVPAPKPPPDPEARRGFWLAFPAMFWMVFFFILPVVLVLWMSFLSRTSGGGELPLTGGNYVDLFEEFYEWDEIQEAWEEFRAAETGADGRDALGELIEPDNGRSAVLFRSMWIAIVSTVICLLMGYPLAYYISTRSSQFTRSLTLFLVILPFWTNLLVRTYAWRIILGREGVLNGVLQWAGFIEEPVGFLFTQGAVIVGLVYVFLPFMVLPIYASIERFDFKLVEAAHDLGANDWSAFWRVVLPGTMPGVVAGCILVFIPSIGAYVTPDLLGGGSGDTLMIGNLIAQWFGGTGHWPRGSAMSIVLMAIVLLSLIVYVRFGQGDDDSRPQREGA
ncbi:MAG: ABC transporter permease [Chloroflexota bacterium]